MIKYSNEEGIISPIGIKFRENQDKNIGLPKVAIGVFSHYLFEDVIEKFQCKEVGYLPNTNADKNIFILKYKTYEFTLFMAGIGGPMISADIEDLHAGGVDKFIIFGNCGVLDSKIEDCSIIIPNKAYREDGTSYHYIEDSETIDLNEKYVDDFINILKEYNFDYNIGPTWTTDAFYRETREKINYYKAKGVLTVEMEGATIAAVAKRRKIDVFTFYYAGDNLDSTEWEERSLSGLANIDKKKEVMNLALELACKMI